MTWLMLMLFHKSAFYVCLCEKTHFDCCSFSNLPSPSSTTAWITIGNTPRSRSKFSFKGKDTFIYIFSLTLANTQQPQWRPCVDVMSYSVTTSTNRCSYLHLLLSTRWNQSWRMAWRTVGSPLACNALFQIPVMDFSDYTCTQDDVVKKG